MEESKQLQQFSRINSTLEPSFWHKLSQLKIEVDKLEEPERNIWGYYRDRSNIAVDVTSFNSEITSGAARGVLVNKNTIEAFRECDKDELLQHHGRALQDYVVSGEALLDPSLVVGRFLLLSFAELKKYQFFYWFAFFAPKSLEVFEEIPARNISEVLSTEQIGQLESQLVKYTSPAFTVCLNEENSLEVQPLSQYKEHALIGFLDPSFSTEPGWPLRSLLWLVAHSWPALQTVDVLCVRRNANGSVTPESPVLRLKLERGDPNRPQWIGWERNERNKMGPKLVDLAASMDPVKLAANAVDLNLRLMKWRLMPDLDLEQLSTAKCLLFGAGTLGCGVARGLLSWGVRHITFVDSGRVGFSNPVRQSLFLHRHCLAGGAAKASTAANSLLDIFPGVQAEGIELSIPMPGHSVPQSQRDEVQATCKNLEQLIVEHDVIFLLTDTRESRWLPTLLAKLHGKITICAALGFDSFLVLRHGVLTEDYASTSSADINPTCKNIPGGQLGCYFCNDVVAPRNSTIARTLDQQCTVVRPGVAQVAAALAVELLVSTLQHPLKGAAPASCDPEQQPLPGGCPLGIVPHSIRGFLAQYQLVLPASSAFSKCAACSPKILNEYRSRGYDFLLQSFETPGYLEKLTGLAELQEQSLTAEVWAISDSDEDAD